MQYTEIIKRAWSITWRYRALWVLGIFAGVSGCQGSTSSRTTNTQGGDPFTGAGPKFGDFDRFVPLIIGGVVALVVIGVIWWLLGLAARGGLVWAVDRIEQGMHPHLGEAWRAGFGTFGKVLGLWLLLQLPIVIFAIALVGAAVGPLVATLFSGGEPGPELLGPLCGVFAIGLPILLIATLILGILDLVALRYIVIGGRGVIDSVRSAWTALMARKKDHFLMWVFNWLLNLVSSFVLAIPFIVIGLVAVFPAIMNAESGDWSAFTGVVGVAVVFMILVSILYTGIWGVFTSSLWTIFFRKLTGMEPPVAVMAPAGAPGYPPAGAPGGYAPQPPAPPSAEYPQPPAPPVAEHPQPPAPPAGE